MQRSAQSSATDNIELKYTWFAQYLEEGAVNTSRKESIAVLTTDNKNNTLASSKPKMYAQEGMQSKIARASNSHKHTVK